jgi:ABC-type nitrate/sulfonate/bicarbonate transport system substrate-binding protein
MRYRWLAVLSAFTCVAFVGSAYADTVTLRVGQVPSTVRSVSSLHFAIGQRQGFYAREGITLQLVPIEGGTDKMVVALDRGDVEITQSATPYFIQAVLAGSNAVAVAAETANPIYSLIVKPEIKSFADLKGKLIGLSLAVDTISISMRKLIALKGLKPTDYRIKELVGTPVRLDCLKRGECDAVPLGQPEDFNAIDQGFHRLGMSTEAISNFEFTISAVRRDWAQSHKDQLVAFLRGFAASFRFIHDSASRDAVAKTIVETTGATEATARAILALYFEPDRGVMPRQGELDLKGLAQVIAFMGEAGVLKAPLPAPERFVDQQYLSLAVAK